MNPALVVVIGAGPAGLMAAERLASQGIAVRVFDHMPSPARKFLMAGRGGLTEPLWAVLMFEAWREHWGYAA